MGQYFKGQIAQVLLQALPKIIPLIRLSNQFRQYLNLALVHYLCATRLRPGYFPLDQSLVRKKQYNPNEKKTRSDPEEGHRQIGAP
jgi:hypothetical protein